MEHLDSGKSGRCTICFGMSHLLRKSIEQHHI